jgi:predicted DNA-binding transcriptional regulator YafY
MDKLERIYRLHRVLSARKTPISRADLMAKLDCSRATLTRLISQSRDFLGSPIRFDRELNGYLLDKNAEEVFELPGLWFNPEEIFALMTSHRLLTEVQPGMLEPYLNPLISRLEKLLKNSHAGDKSIFDRVRILQMNHRIARLEDFQKIAGALVSRQQLRIQYRSRGNDELTERWVSPQRLIYYRDNWYLDAWCHLRKALRTFSVDRLNVSEAGKVAQDISDKHMDAYFSSTYGIFSGPVKGQAVIRFSSQVSRWVADESWHPEQQFSILEDGGCELTVPFSDPRELIMDILKYGPDAEVLGPATLRKVVEEKLSQSLRKYRKMR